MRLLRKIIDTLEKERLMFAVQALKSLYLSVCWASKYRYVENLEDP